MNKKADLIKIGVLIFLGLIILISLIYFGRSDDTASLSSYKPITTEAKANTETTFFDKTIANYNNVTVISLKEYTANWYPSDSPLADFKDLTFELQIETNKSNISLIGKTKVPKYYSGSFIFNSSNPNLVEFTGLKDLKIEWSYSLRYTEFGKSYSDTVYDNSEEIPENIKEGEEKKEPIILSSVQYNVTEKSYYDYTLIKDETELKTIKDTYLSGAYLDPDVTSCGNIVTSGYYNLSQNINSSANCININASNVDLQCHGYTINSTQTNKGIGVYVFNVNNVTIRNCNFLIQNSTGATSIGKTSIGMLNVTNSTIYNNTINIWCVTGGSSTSSCYGINITRTIGINISNNFIGMNLGRYSQGMRLIDANSTWIANNFINGTSLSDNFEIYTTRVGQSNIINNSMWKTGGDTSLYLSSFVNSNVTNNKLITLGNSADETSDGSVIYLTNSYNNNFTGNNLTAMNAQGFRYYSSDALSFHTNNYIDQTNDFNGLPILYVKDNNSFSLVNQISPYGQIIIDNSSNSNFYNVTFNNTQNGISIYFGTNITIDSSNLTTLYSPLHIVNMTNSNINNSIFNTDTRYTSDIHLYRVHGNNNFNNLTLFPYHSGTGSEGLTVYNSRYNQFRNIIIYHSSATSDNQLIYGVTAVGNYFDSLNINHTSSSVASTVLGYSIQFTTNSWDNVINNSNIWTDGNKLHSINLGGSKNNLTIINSNITCTKNDTVRVSVSTKSTINFINTNWSELDISATTLDARQNITVFNYNYLSVNVTETSNYQPVNQANVSIYFNNGTWIDSELTGIDGFIYNIPILEFIWNNSANWTYQLNYTINVTKTDYANYSDFSFNISEVQRADINITSLLGGADTSYPIFFNNQTSLENNTAYSPSNLWQFNITINNTNSTAGMEFAGVNYTMNNITDVYNATLTGLSAGSYSYYFWAFGNGSSNNYNISETFSYTIAKATGIINGTINNTQGNFTAINGTATQNIYLNLTNITGIGTGTIYLNGTAINSGTMPLFNITNLSIGFYNVTFVYDGNANYTGTEDIWWINVSAAPTIILNYPQINFTYPTPPDWNETASTNVIINVSINESSLYSLTYNWNGTNYSFYDKNLLVFYNFENLSSLGENAALVRDLSSYSYNATCASNCPTQTVGKYGNGYYFNNNYLNISRNDNIDVATSNFTYNIWFNSTATSTAEIVCKQSGTATSATAGFRTVISSTSTTGISAVLGNGSNNYRLDSGTTTCRAGSLWCMLTVVVDRSTNNMSMYFNGVFVKSMTIGTGSIANNYDLRLGNTVDGTASRQFIGSLDNFMLFNKSLSYEEIQEIYMSNLQRLNPNDWNFYINQSKLGNPLDNGNYTYQVFVNNSNGLTNQTELRHIKIGIAGSEVTSPVVNLIAPTNGSNSTTPTINFNFTTTDNSLKNATLYFSSSSGGTSSITKVQNVTGSTATSAVTVTCTFPTAPTAGNTIITAVSSDKNAGTYTAPPGFTIVQTTSATSTSGAIAYKVSDGSETVVRWNQSATSTAGMGCWAAEYSGLSASPLDVSAENETYSGADTAATSISSGLTSSTTQDNELAIAFVTVDTMTNCDGSRAWTNGFSEDGFKDVGGSGGTGIVVANKTLTSAGAQSTVYSCTGDTGDQMYAAIVTFKAAASTGISWHANKTIDISGTSNSTNITQTLADNSTYLWNILVCDNSNNCAFNNTNYTLIINSSLGAGASDTTPPKVSLTSPLNNNISNSTTISFNFTATDASLKNATLYFCNASTTNTGEQAVAVTWIANRSQWKYNNSDVYPGENWFNQSFDDSTWSNGSAYLATAAETAGVGLNTSLGAGAPAYISYYFRKNFTITDATKVVNMSFNVDYDDAYAVYINGNIINTSNATGCDWTNHNAYCQPLHNSMIDTSGAGTPYFPLTILNSTHLSYLVTGTNYIAVVIKQNAAGSTDAAFELTLYGYENQTGGSSTTCSGWHANKTIDISGTTNSTNITQVMLDNRTYYWNILVCDNSNNCAFNNTNYTLYVNTSYSPPVIPYVAPVLTWCGLHMAHTTYSDGTMSQDEFTNNAKAYFDCAGTGDHDTSLSQAEWTDWINRANANNSDGNFTYFFGTEWSGSQHIYYVTLNPPATQQDAGDAQLDTVAELAAWMQQNSSVGQHNHPARTSGGTDFSNSANYNETYITLVEMVNQQSGTVSWHWSYYFNCSANSGCTSYSNPKQPGAAASGTGWVRYALDAGIHLGFSCGNDYHGAYPLNPFCYTGLANRSTTFNRSGIYNELRARHTWVAENKTLMNVQASNGSSNFMMGDIFSYYNTSNNITISYAINATPGQTIVNVSLFWNGVIVNLTRLSGQQNVSGTFIQNLSNNGKEDYLFIEAIQANGQRAWSSPMWINHTGSAPAADTLYPSFSNNQTSPNNNTEYYPSGLWQFNITIANTNGTTGIEFSGANYTLSNISSVFNKTFTDLGVGIYSYYYWAFSNGTNHYYNTSATYSYTIAKNSSYGIALAVTNPLTYPAQTDFAGSGCPAQLSCSLNVTNGVFPAGTVSANYSTVGNANYTAKSATATTTINKNATRCDVAFNETSPLTYPAKFKVYSNCTSPFTIYRNGTIVANYSEQALGAGNYNFTVYRNDTQNYSNIVDEETFTINRATSSVGLTVTSPITYGTTTDFTGTGCPSGATCTLNVTNGVFPAGTVSANYSFSGNQNYSGSSAVATVTINQATPTLTFLANGGTLNLSLIYPQQVNISARASAGTLGLDKDSVNYASNSINVTLGVSSYLFRANITGNENYSSISYYYLNVTINQSTGVINGTINNTQGNFTAINGTATQNIYLNLTNITGIGTGTIYLNGTAINSGTMPLFNITNLSIGFYNVTFVYDGNQNYTASSQVWWINITIGVSDNVYPIFYGYWDDNATLTDTGLASFNISVNNTNGTVFLQINSVNVAAQNITANVYNVSYYFTSGGSYTYRWYAYGNGTIHNLNNSEERYYTVFSTYNPPSSSGGGFNPKLPSKDLYAYDYSLQKGEVKKDYKYYVDYILNEVFGVDYLAGKISSNRKIGIFIIFSIVVLASYFIILFFKRDKKKKEDKDKKYVQEL